ncbi:hypothetical protein RhiJN_14445 [Ceratobasidium sp. AG-Ba]|nr:hypothetical protein RhiJN_14445 [Ceratobasidium sp. AG-Ba]QRW14988.1 hypothetical protein RhiLY_13987 [Ceratobasidium sp. AG-Ba]
MPITPDPSHTVVVHQFSSRAPSSNFTLSAPPARKRPVQRTVIPATNQQPCKPTSPACSPRSSPNNRRRPSVTLRSPLQSFLSFVDSPENTIRRSSVSGIGLGRPGTRLSPSALNTIVAFASGKSHRRSVSGPLPSTAWSFETHFAPSSPPVKASAFAALALTPSPTRSTPTPVRVLFERSRTLAALKAKPQDTPSPRPNPRKPKTRPAPVMATKDGHVNVLLLPKRREKDMAGSIRSNNSASTSASKSKSRKDAQSTLGSGASGKTQRPATNPALRAQRSMTPAREAFRPLPYATHAALDEFFGDPRKMNALHAHQSASNQLGARSDEVGYGNTIGHKGADGWIWFDALEEQEYAWLMGDSNGPLSPDTPKPRKEKKKSKRRGFLGRRDSTSESEGGQTDWESFDALRRGSESGTSDGGIVDPMTYDLDPTRPPRYRAVADGFARYRVDGTAWDAAVQVRGRQKVGGATTPKNRRGRSRRGSATHGDAGERRRPPPLNLAAVSSTLAALASKAAPTPTARSPVNLSARRGSMPILGSRLPPSLADVARADFVSSSFQPNPSKRDLNLDPETPWSANLPKDTIYKSIAQSHIPASPGSPFKSMFSRRASLTPLPLRHSPLPLPNSNSGFEFKGDGSLPKLPPMPMENGAPTPGTGEVKRKASLADIFRRGFSSRRK